MTRAEMAQAFSAVGGGDFELDFAVSARSLLIAAGLFAVAMIVRSRRLPIISSSGRAG